jgi:hypothetical protein
MTGLGYQRTVRCCTSACVWCRQSLRKRESVGSHARWNVRASATVCVATATYWHCRVGSLDKQRSRSSPGTPCPNPNLHSQQPSKRGGETGFFSTSRGLLWVHMCSRQCVPRDLHQDLAHTHSAHAADRGGSPSVASKHPQPLATWVPSPRPLMHIVSLSGAYRIAVTGDNASLGRKSSTTTLS